MIKKGKRQNDRYNTLKTFMDVACCQPNHWCNGKHIPNFKDNIDLSKIPDLSEPCRWFVNKRCTHYLNPNNRKK